MAILPRHADRRSGSGTDARHQFQQIPIWARGKKITVTEMTVYAVSWTGQPFTLQPQAPLPIANVNLNAPGLPNLLASGPLRFQRRISQLPGI